MGVGDKFQSETKYLRGELPRGGLDWANKPPVYKRYPSAPRVSLSAPQRAGGAPIWGALQQRRSVRQFQDAPLTNAELSQLLWAAQGVTLFNRDVGFRTAPSAGALYPIETYLALHAVEGIEPGLYHYVVEEHELEQLRVGDLRETVAQAALDQPIAARAGVVFIWTAIFERAQWKYKQRAYRYIYLDAGHIAQNVALGAVALGLGSCQVAAFYDEETNTLLGVDGRDESAIYMTVVGKQ
jgi:SagB-type dehydrogenase family enzyme